MTYQFIEGKGYPKNILDETTKISMCLKILEQNDKTNDKTNDKKNNAFMLTARSSLHEDPTKERFDLIQAVKENVACAQFLLGYSFEREGKFVKAVFFYRQAAEQGLPQAQVSLGLLLKGVKGVDRNIVEARHWIRKAVDCGFLQAFKELAILNGEEDAELSKSV